MQPKAPQHTGYGLDKHVKQTGHYDVKTHEIIPDWVSQPRGLGMKSFTEDLSIGIADVGLDAALLKTPVIGTAAVIDTAVVAPVSGVGIEVLDKGLGIELAADIEVEDEASVESIADIVDIGKIDIEVGEPAADVCPITGAKLGGKVETECALAAAAKAGTVETLDLEIGGDIETDDVVVADLEIAEPVKEVIPEVVLEIAEPIKEVEADIEIADVAEHKVEDLKVETPKVETPKVEAPKVEAAPAAPKTPEGPAGPHGPHGPQSYQTPSFGDSLSDIFKSGALNGGFKPGKGFNFGSVFGGGAKRGPGGMSPMGTLSASLGGGLGGGAIGGGLGGGLGGLGVPLTGLTLDLLKLLSKLL